MRASYDKKLQRKGAPQWESAYTQHPKAPLETGPKKGSITMKNTISRFAALSLAVLTVLSATACAPSGAGMEPAQAETTLGPGAENEGFTLGVIQFGSHPSLDNCYTGIEEALKGAEVTIDLQNGNFDSATCDGIAKNMAARNYDLIVAIATPAALSAYGATKNTDIPVVFCAVSDPVAAGLVDTVECPGGNCTGTSDVLDLSAQLALITAFQPEAQRIGVLYTTSEANSVSQLARLEELAEEAGVEIVARGVQGAADIPQAAAALCAQVDCVNNFTDNNVVSNLSVLLEQANAAGVPVYGSEEEQVKNGCLACVGIDYVALGRETGDMALRILSGEEASGMAVRQITDATPIYNSQALKRFSMTLPDIYANALDVAQGE